MSTVFYDVLYNNPHLNDVVLALISVLNSYRPAYIFNSKEGGGQQQQPSSYVSKLATCYYLCNGLLCAFELDRRRIQLHECPPSTTGSIDIDTIQKAISILSSFSHPPSDVDNIIPESSISVEIANVDIGTLDVDLLQSLVVETSAKALIRGMRILLLSQRYPLESQSCANILKIKPPDDFLACTDSQLNGRSDSWTEYLLQTYNFHHEDIKVENTCKSVLVSMVTLKSILFYRSMAANFTSLLPILKSDQEELWTQRFTDACCNLSVALKYSSSKFSRGYDMPISGPNPKSYQVSEFLPVYVELESLTWTVMQWRISRLYPGFKSPLIDESEKKALDSAESLVIQQIEDMAYKRLQGMKNKATISRDVHYVFALLDFIELVVPVFKAETALNACYDIVSDIALTSTVISLRAKAFSIITEFASLPAYEPVLHSFSEDQSQLRLSPQVKQERFEQWRRCLSRSDLIRELALNISSWINVNQKIFSQGSNAESNYHDVFLENNLTSSSTAVVTSNLTEGLARQKMQSSTGPPSSMDRLTLDDTNQWASQSPNVKSESYGSSTSPTRLISVHSADKKLKVPSVETNNGGASTSMKIQSEASKNVAVSSNRKSSDYGITAPSSQSSHNSEGSFRPYTTKTSISSQANSEVQSFSKPAVSIQTEESSSVDLFPFDSASPSKANNTSSLARKSAIINPTSNSSETPPINNGNVGDPSVKSARDKEFSQNFPFKRQLFQYPLRNKNILNRSRPYIMADISPNGQYYVLLDEKKWAVYKMDISSPGSSSPSLICGGKNNGEYGPSNNLYGLRIAEDKEKDKAYSSEYAMCSLSNRYLAIAWHSGLIKVHDILNGGQPVYSYHEYVCITALSLSPNSAVLACGTQENLASSKDKNQDKSNLQALIVLHQMPELGTGRKYNIKSTYGNSPAAKTRVSDYSIIRTISFSDDSLFLACSTSRDCLLMVVNVQEPRRPRLVMKSFRKLDIVREADGVTCMEFFRGSRILVITAYADSGWPIVIDSRVSMGKVAKPSMITKVREMGCSLYRCATSPRGDSIAFINSEGTVNLVYWPKMDTERRYAVTVFKTATPPCLSEAAPIRFSPDGQKLLALDRRGVLYIADFTAPSSMVEECARVKSN